MLGCVQEQKLGQVIPNLSWDNDLVTLDTTIEKDFRNAVFQTRKLKLTNVIKAEDRYLIIESNNNVSLKNSKKLFSEKNAMIKEYYTIQATPYSGAITKEAECLNDIQLAPNVRETKDELSFQYNLKATDRLVLGVCQSEQNKFYNQILLLYCKKTNVFFDIKYFYPILTNKLVHPIAKCPSS